MTRPELIALLVGASFAGPRAAAAQDTGKVYRIGILTSDSSASLSAGLAALRDALSKRGYISGKNLYIDVREPFGDFKALSALATGLVELKPDVIVVQGNPATAAAKRATTTIPVIMTGGADPVGAGFIASLSAPGGNVTGLTSMNQGLGAKQVELLKELVPGLNRIAVIRVPALPTNLVLSRAAETAARALGLGFVAVDITSIAGLESALTAFSAQHNGGVVFLPNPIIGNNPARVIRVVANLKLPAIYPPTPPFTKAGGLMQYAASEVGQWVRVAYFVDRILKGAKPEDLPVEQPTKFQLSINLKTATALGLTVPQSLLIQADEVIR